MIKDNVIFLDNPIKLPQIGQEFVIEGINFKVVYRNPSKKIFTSESIKRENSLPEIGTVFVIPPFRYIVDFINQEKLRFNSKFYF